MENRDELPIESRGNFGMENRFPSAPARGWGWKFISYLFHPAIMPTLGTLVVIWNNSNLYNSIYNLQPLITVIGAVFFCTYVLPLTLSWILLKIGRISSIKHPTENDRRVLLGFTSICFIGAYWLFHNIDDSGKTLKILMLGINISIIATLIISMFTKVSFHCVGVGGLLGTVIGLMHYTQLNLIPWITGAFVITILTALSRYKLKAHNAFEIYIGLIIGISINALVFILNRPGI